jgi:hypothetical protein
MNSQQKFLSHSVGCFFILMSAETFEFDAIPFVSSCSYFLSYWSPIQKVFGYIYIFQCFPEVVSKFQILH